MSNKDSVIQWLNAQPISSVVFLCFGSMGISEEAQIKEIAKGLENSGHRFLLTLRKPSDPAPKGKPAPSSENETFLGALPMGFINRTAVRGKIIGWVPQVDVLVHHAIGGFVSHYGWNSASDPAPKGKPAPSSENETFLGALPMGFINRTAVRGKIIGWVPQVDVLVHHTIGGFVSHYGWNSASDPAPKGKPAPSSENETFLGALPMGYINRTAVRGKIIGWVPQVDVLVHHAIGGFVSHYGWNSASDPAPKGKPAPSSENETFLGALPMGFINRTAVRGKIIGWVPQVDVLVHHAIGGFVSHYGWNSASDPAPKGKPAPSSENETFLGALPMGFINRTAVRGKIIGWVPQVDVLVHHAIGGFVSHYGWNSALESVWFGVPMANWPIYVKKQSNALSLVKELAVEIRTDCKRDMRVNTGKILARAEEIEKGINKLMMENVINIGECSKKASKGGESSYNWLGRFIEDLNK